MFMLCILYVEWPARARAEAGWSSIYDHFIADLTLPITRCRAYSPESRCQADYRSPECSLSPEVGDMHQEAPSPWSPVWPVSLIRDTKIFVSRCLEATGRPHKATIHPAIYFPARHDLCELFMIFLFDHKDFIQLSQEPRQHSPSSKQQF